MKPRATTGSFERMSMAEDMIIETNYWKSFMHSRLNIAIGDKGIAFAVWPKSRTEHKMIAEHILAENPKNDEANGRKDDNLWIEVKQAQITTLGRCFELRGTCFSMWGEASGSQAIQPGWWKDDRQHQEEKTSIKI